MLKLKNVSKIYYLKDVSLELPRKGLVSILGPSGCGKTTLLNILGGLDTNYTGVMVVDDVDTKTFKQKD